MWHMWQSHIISPYTPLSKSKIKKIEIETKNKNKKKINSSLLFTVLTSFLDV